MSAPKFFGPARRRGSAAVVALVAVTVLVGLCGAMLMIASRSNSEGGAAVDRHQASAAAQAGIDEALVGIATGNMAAGDMAAGNDVELIGSPEDPRPFGGGTYWVEVTRDVDAGICTVASFAEVRGEREAMEALLTSGGMDIYDHALFAGNSSDDPLYDLKLGGTGVQADQVVGDVYSGGGVAVTGDANVDGTVRAQDEVTGTPGESGVYQPTPDLAAMDYPNTADFKVAELFGAATYQSNSLGGRAYQLPESSPAHIFRKNPSDRATDTGATVKDDFFLEDPYERVSTSSTVNVANATTISLAGVSGEPGASGNHKVYYIDGNLWIHNRNIYSFAFKHNEPNGIQVTFVARGNIYFSDNILYDDSTKDGIAFIAMTDDKVADSGNIYFGDPVFGTLEQMQAFMYAENNFIDKNLSATGSAQVTVYGNMTAGNKVDIQRDHGSQHSKLTINYDGRISMGDLDMPGIPTADGGGNGAWTFQAVRRIAYP
jgi:hypothetical protein